MIFYIEFAGFSILRYDWDSYFPYLRGFYGNSVKLNEIWNQVQFSNWKSHRGTDGSGANYRCWSVGTDKATGTSGPDGPLGNCRSRDSHWRRSNATASIRRSNRNWSSSKLMSMLIETYSSLVTSGHWWTISTSNTSIYTRRGRSLHLFGSSFLFFPPALFKIFFFKRFIAAISGILQHYWQILRISLS